MEEGLQAARATLDWLIKRHLVSLRARNQDHNTEL